MSEKDDDQKKQAAGKGSEGSGNRPNSFTDIFQGIGNLINLATSIEEGKREAEITDPSGRFKAAFHFSVKTGLPEGMEVEHAVRKRGPSQGPTVEEEIQPFVDVFDEESYVLVIAELPGVEEKDIHIEVKGDILTLSAANGPRKYSREVILPSDVDSSTMESKYKNGVLEIRMSKKSHG